MPDKPAGRGHQLQFSAVKQYALSVGLPILQPERLKDETFLDIISAKKWTTTVGEKSGAKRTVTWNQSNQFINGARKVPKGISLFGGKTGTTFDAGACIILYGKNKSDTPYISIIMGASSRRNLYDNMTYLLAAIPD